MKTFQIFVILILVATLNACANPRISSRDKNYVLEWEDNFNGFQLDTTYWSKIPRERRATSYRHLSDDPRLFQLRKGILRLYAQYNGPDRIYSPKDTAEYLTAGITTKHKVSFTYGKIVVRARIHGAYGSWPAVWIMPEEKRLWDAKVSDYAEIDMLEYVDRNDFVYQTAHNAYTLKDKKNWHHPEQQNLSKINVDMYNTYSVEILPDEIIFGINGEETFRYPKCPDIKDQYHYGVPSHLIMNMQVYPPKFWRSAMQPESFPAYMDIDWVKIYNLRK